jgi:hypothetical protein
MWTLKAVGRDPSIFTIPTSGVVKVGRHEECHVQIAKDQSVSRVHCEIAVEDQGGIFLKDCGSKFGTFLNGAQVKADVKVVIKNGDLVKFGALTSEYRFECVDDTAAQVLSKYEVVELLLNGRPVPSDSPFRPRHMDRNLLLDGVKVKCEQHLEEFVAKCGGQVGVDGEVWSEQEIFDAILYGKLKNKPTHKKMAIIAEYTLPQPSKMLSSMLSSAASSVARNVKRFRKVQPLSLPDIIGLADMAAHHQLKAVISQTQPSTSKKTEEQEWIQPLHPEYQPKRPIEQYFEGGINSNIASNAGKRAKQAASVVDGKQDFQTDFFKSLL